MTKGKTKSGFEFEISKDALDDYELLETIHKVDTGDYGYIVKMVEQLLGTEQKEKLKEHVRNEHGKVSSTAMLNEITEVFEACKELKN